MIIIYNCILIVLIIILFLAFASPDNEKPSCYKDKDSDVTYVCTGDACPWKSSCKYFINYMNDN